MDYMIFNVHMWSFLHAYAYTRGMIFRYVRENLVFLMDVHSAWVSVVFTSVESAQNPTREKSRGERKA